MGLQAAELPEHRAVHLVVILEVILFSLALQTVFGLHKPPLGTGLMAAFTVAVAGGAAGDHRSLLLSYKKENSRCGQEQARWRRLLLSGC